MDFWSRLIGGAGVLPSSKPAHSNNPQQRLARFKRLHDQLLQLRRTYRTIATDPTTVENVRTCLESIKHLIQIDIQAPAPHLCVEYVAESQMYVAAAKVASLSNNEIIVREALDLSNVLIDSEEGSFVEDKALADALMALVSTISRSGSLKLKTESEMVEVLFGIAAKLRLQPDILPTWFRPQMQEIEEVTERTSASGLTSRSDKKDFPLFYLLLNYVHYDGRVGDFARTGLLYIIESATHSEKLERWIVESDLATLMASGLGALYSQLSRKLVLSFPKGSIPAIVAFSDVPPPQPPFDAEMTNSEDFQAHLGTFLSYLVFWQDVLEHCTSNDVKQTLLDHFEFLFLRQLLYPSLMESSDIDGGSSVAVLTYLRCILESIDHPDLIHLILQYLLALPKGLPEDLSKARPTTLARRRKSENLIINLATGEEKPSPDLFTLVDLILTSLRSHNQQTVTATLRLISVILRSQHRYAVSSLIRVNRTKSYLKRTIDAHDTQMDILLSTAEDLAVYDGLSVSYETHLHDARSLLEAHPYSLSLLALPKTDIAVEKSTATIKIQDKARPVQAHTVASEDPLLKALLSLLANFLRNDIETNLSLTQSFSTLASCGYTNMEGWLLVDAGGPDVPSVLETNLADNLSTDDLKEDQQPIACEYNSPMFAVFDSLLKQIDLFRQEILDFDTYLAERRHVFMIGEEIDNALAGNPTRCRKAGLSKNTSPTRTKSLAHASSISQRLLPDSNSSTVSRSGSPRGRQRNDLPISALVGRLNHLQITPSPSPSKTAQRAYSPSPLREDSFSSTPPRFISTPMGPADALRQKIKMTIDSAAGRNNPCEVAGSESSSLKSETVGSTTESAEDVKEISLSHLLTNVIILQEFLLEIAAIVEVRVSLFDEVTFT